MPAQISRRRHRALRAVLFLWSILLAMNAVATTWAECVPCPCQPLTSENLEVGVRVDSSELPSELRTVEIYFEVRSTSEPQEEYTLKISEVDETGGSAPSCLRPPKLLASRSFVVPTAPGPTQWHTVHFSPPVEYASASVLVAVEVTPEQLQSGAVIPLMADIYGCEEADCEEAAYFSISNCAVWEPLYREKLNCLKGDGSACTLNGTTRIRIRVKPS